MPPDLWTLYPLMLKSRLFEELVAQLWRDGRISGEMHLGTGEEAVIAGVLSHLQEGDALALDHRGTAALLMRGVDPVLLLREMLGQPDGLCGGRGGHMHLFSKGHLAASSGIVGSSGPAAAGFALAAQLLRPGTLAVAFFGEGAMNQGNLMESMNLAAAWKLPVLFACKDDGWSITARSDHMTAGSLDERARSLGLAVFRADGLDVSEVWNVAGQAAAHVRTGRGPAFLHARCVHMEAHFLGFQLLNTIRSPLVELPRAFGPMLRSLFALHGGPLRERLAGVWAVLAVLTATRRDARRDPLNDPLYRARLPLRLDPDRLRGLEQQVSEEMLDIRDRALQEVTS